MRIVDVADMELVAGGYEPGDFPEHDYEEVERQLPQLVDLLEDQVRRNGPRHG
ncbi:hypothetical protein [Pseudoxanthomonas sp. J35]|uniref:hypothetical protein n=1 Tax=Pseudoxanthomonas sp. J35 TaxID=935852 RepID=UPI0012ECB1BF|nr:hypothetical protein [Pseudoxanthomonas sp. J35]